MPIDVSVPRSPGWWMKRLFNQLNDPVRVRRLQLLHDYQHGNAPLPDGAESAREAYRGFQKKARTNFAELIVAAMSERMSITGFQSALDDDVTGDAEIGRLWRLAAMPTVQADVHDMMLGLSEAYVIVGNVDPEFGAPTVTCEDPRYMVGETDPANERKLLAALKVYHDPVDNEDRAYLYLPGRVFVARRKSNGYTIDRLNPSYDRSKVRVGFAEQAWDEDLDRSGPLPHGRIPVVKFKNKGGEGEFENHLDHLDRVNHQTLQRLMVAVLQAFRQRGIKGLPEVYPDDHELAGQVIDYADFFTSDAAALWQLPESAEIWESQQVDLRPLLEAVKEDVTHLASVTRTPLHMLLPGGDNQSAEGAQSQKEGLNNKVGDRNERTSPPWCLVASLLLLHDGQTERADFARLTPIWAPVASLSLAEKADAASKLAGIMPRRTLFIKVLQMTPAEADQAMSELEDEKLAEQLAAQAAIEAEVRVQERLAVAAGRGQQTIDGTTSGQQQVGQRIVRPAIGQRQATRDGDGDGVIGERS